MATDDGTGIMTIAILAFIGLLFMSVVLYASRFKRCPSDKILVIYGKTGEGQFAQTHHGGGKFVWPLFQDYAFLDLKPMTINIDLQNALSQQNIRINVPSTFTIGVSTVKHIMQNAAERLLGLQPANIEEMAKEIIFGQLRLTVATLTIEQINQDRESFLELIRTNVEPELSKVGLFLINVNITDITDEADYIESIGKKAASEAVNKAKVDVAEAERDGAVGQAEADRQKEVAVAENHAEAEKGKKAAFVNQRVYVQEQESIGIDGENKSKAEIAGYNAGLAEKEAEALQRAEVARRGAETEIQKAQYKLEQERLKAEEIVREEIAKTQVEIAAEAEAERTRRIAQGEADAILSLRRAEAEGISEVLNAKAAGYDKLVAASGGDPKAAATLLMVEKIESIVSSQVEAISNLKIDKITVWDSGGNAGEGSSTSNFVSNLINTLPPMHDVAKMAGVDLPSYLGSMAEDAEN